MAPGPVAQFFLIQTSWMANNICILSLHQLVISGGAGRFTLNLFSRELKAFRRNCKLQVTELMNCNKDSQEPHCRQVSWKYNTF